MKPKYIDEALPEVYIFGTNPVTGHVDIATVNGDLVTKVRETEAKRAIEYIDALKSLIHFFNSRYPEEFEKAFKEWKQSQEEKDTASGGLYRY